MLSPIFRPLIRKDIPAVVRMSRENMASIILSSWGVEYRDEDLLEILLRKRSETEVVEVNGFLAGYFSVERKSNTLFINSIQVAKSFQRQGIGKAMMERIEAMAKQRGLRSVDLWVQVTNHRAMDFYLHLGYRMIARQGNNYLMRKGTHG